MTCLKCGKKLTNNDIGLHKKLINRGDEKFMCIDCLAEKFGCTHEFLQEKIKQFKETGCLLFS